MYDYPHTSNDNYDDRQDDGGLGALRAIQQTLTWALELPADPEFKEFCDLFEGAEGIIKQIRQKCKNADDLAKIVSAIEVMREELIEESSAKFERLTHK
jgi:hypothetical protein